MNEWRERKRSRGVSYFIHSLGYVRVCTMTQIKRRRWRESREEKSVGAKRRGSEKRGGARLLWKWALLLLLLLFFVYLLDAMLWQAENDTVWRVVRRRRRRKNRPTLNQKEMLVFFYFLAGNVVQVYADCPFPVQCDVPKRKREPRGTSSGRVFNLRPSSVTSSEHKLQSTSLASGTSQPNQPFCCCGALDSVFVFLSRFQAQRCGGGESNFSLPQRLMFILVPLVHR